MGAWKEQYIPELDDPGDEQRIIRDREKQKSQWHFFGRALDYDHPRGKEWIQDIVDGGDKSGPKVAEVHGRTEKEAIDRAADICALPLIRTLLLVAIARLSDKGDRKFAEEVHQQLARVGVAL